MGFGNRSFGLLITADCVILWVDLHDESERSCFGNMSQSSNNFSYYTSIFAKLVLLNGKLSLGCHMPRGFAQNQEVRV